VVVLWLKGLVPNGYLTVENPGGSLAVTISGENGIVRELTLEGPTEIVRQYDL
jgi:diaminopimelate epimerase